ncbi:MAG: hypothetical protein FWD34_00500 [Oscillospiraceae bacterium]|nr:hypothetical protein [Oscillospiraceae bacterium]
MKRLISRITLIAAIFTAGIIAVFNVPEAVESFLPKVDTISLIKTDYCEKVSGAGIISEISGEWFVSISVGEGDIRKVEKGQSADIIGTAFDDGIYTATVYEIGSIASRKPGEYAYEIVVEVILKIDNPYDSAENMLRSGYTARAEIKTDDEKSIFIVPYSVICQDDIGEYVYVLSGNSAVRRDILTGVELADGAEVLKGLSENDEIIASPEHINGNTLVSRREHD